MDRKSQLRKGQATVIIAVLGVFVLIFSVYSLSGMFSDRVPPMRRIQEAPATWYRAALLLEEGELPFFLKVPNATGSGYGILVNGQEEINVDVSREDLDITIGFPHYDSRITATIRPTGALSGGWHKTSKGGERRTIPFQAHPVDDPLPEQRFPFAPADLQLEKGSRPGDFSHVWRLDFAQGGRAKGVFRQTVTGVVTGTILTPTGDYRYLAGRVFGPELLLSTFDGSHAFLFRARLDDTGQAFNGTFWSGNHWKEAFTGVRADHVKLPAPLDQTRLRDGHTTLGLKRLTEPPYAGAPVIVTVMGTWCPNCHDEAELIRKIARQNSATDLQVLGLAFEYTDDADRSDRQIDVFKRRHDIEWEVIAMGTSSKDTAAAALPGVDQIKSYPTTFFIRRDGTVHRIHTGFAGPATGHAYLELARSFEQLTAEIVR